MGYLPVVIGAAFAAMAGLGYLVLRLARQSYGGHAQRLPRLPFRRTVSAGDPCTGCRTGRVRHARGRYGEFLGCSNFDRKHPCWRAWTADGRYRIRRDRYGSYRIGP